MATLNVKNFEGGESLLAATTLKDNQFSLLRNFSYNDSKRPQSRRGTTTFGQPVPDAAVLINACDATTNFVAADDGTNLTTGTAIRGTFAVSFDITVASSGNNDALLSNAVLGAVNITTAKGYVSFWLYVPAAFNTNLTDVKFRLGTDSSNYYEWTLSALTVASNNFVKLLFSDATTTGTVTDSNINYLRLAVNYTASYTDKLGIKIDSIYCSSATSTKAISSYMYFERDDNNTTTALVAAGTNFWLYNETSTYWEPVKTGLTEFETATGRTTEKTRWEFAVYKNIMYMCNGIDNYQTWNGTLFTEYAAQPKPRYLLYMSDRVFGFGADANPISLYYIASGAADAQTLNTNTVVIGGDEMGRGTGLFQLGQVIAAGKEKKIYSVDVTNTTSVAIDARDGLYSHRATANVGNAIIYFSDNGVTNLQARYGVSGGAAMEQKALTDDLQPLITQITSKQLNAGCGFSALPLNNYYFSFDTNNDNIPDTTIVRSSLTGGWSEYNLLNMYAYGEYKDTSYVYHYLFASANGGQMYEFETGFNDNSAAIDCELQTKEWDFDEPSVWKDFQSVDIYGLASENAVINVAITIDDTVNATGIISGDFIDITATATPLGLSPIGITTAGGGSGSGEAIDLFPYKIRIPMFYGGQSIKVTMDSSTADSAWTLDRMAVTFDNNTFDLFPTANIS